MSCVFSKISTGKKYNPERCRGVVGGFPSGWTASTPSGSYLSECQSFNSCLTRGQFIFYEAAHSFKQQRGQNISGGKLKSAISLFSHPDLRNWKGPSGHRCCCVAPLHARVEVVASLSGAAWVFCRLRKPFPTPRGSLQEARSPPLQHLHSAASPSFYKAKLGNQNTFNILLLGLKFPSLGCGSSPRQWRRGINGTWLSRLS